MHPSIACKRKSRQNRWILVYYKAISPFPWIYLSVAVGCSPYGILLIFFHRDLGLYRVMDVGRHGRGNALDNLSRIVFHQARLQTHYNFPWFPLAIHLSIEELEIVFWWLFWANFGRYNWVLNQPMQCWKWKRTTLPPQSLTCWIFRWWTQE